MKANPTVQNTSERQRWFPWLSARSSQSATAPTDATRSDSYTRGVPLQSSVAVGIPCSGPFNPPTRNKAVSFKEPKNIADAIRQGNHAALRTLAQKATLTDLTDALKPAVAAGDGEAVDILLSRGANSFADPGLQREAARLGHEKVVSAYLKNGFAPENFITDGQKTSSPVLSVIAEYARRNPCSVPAIVRMAVGFDAIGAIHSLIEHGVKIADRKGSSCDEYLNLAVKLGKRDCMDFFLKVARRPLSGSLFSSAMTYEWGKDRGPICAALLRAGVTLNRRDRKFSITLRTLYVEDKTPKGQLINQWAEKILANGDTKAVAEREVLARIFEEPSAIPYHSN